MLASLNVYINKRKDHKKERKKLECKEHYLNMEVELVRLALMTIIKNKEGDIHSLEKVLLQLELIFLLLFLDWELIR